MESEDQEIEQLKASLARRAKLRGDSSIVRAHDSAQTPSTVDLKRFGQLGIAVDESDRWSFQQPKPTADCLRPDQVMLLAGDLVQGATPEAKKHVQECRYCQAFVALSKADIVRHREFIRKLAEPHLETRDVGSDAVSEEALVIPITSRMFEVLSGAGLAAASAAKYVVPLAACLALLFFVTPDSLRLEQPHLFWTTGQLQRSALTAFEEGGAVKAEGAFSELIERDPGNPIWRALRSEAYVEKGDWELARKDIDQANRLFKDLNVSLLLDSQKVDSNFKASVSQKESSEM